MSARRRRRARVPWPLGGKSLLASSFTGLVLAMLVAGDKAADHPMLDKLAAEANTLKAERPERWKQYHQQAEGVFAANEIVVAHWQKRSSPPPPDLTPCRLPLSFLVDALRQEEPRAKPEPGRAARERHLGRRHDAYLRAIVHSADERRLAALLEYREHFLRWKPENRRPYPWGKLLADAATLPWAVNQIKERAQADPPFAYGRGSEHLLYGLIDRFAGELPADARTAAYRYVREQAPDGPTGNEAERLWDVLFRLDARRAGREVLPSFATPSGARLRYNYRVVVLLARHPGPSAEVAAAVRRWLATQADLSEFNRRQLAVVLLRADPDREVGPAVRRIDQLLAEQRQKGARFESGGEVHLLVLAMGDVESKAVEEPLARYVFDRSIDTGVRFLILEALVKRRYGKSAALVARWLAEEPEHMQRHCREEATRHWGAFGREVLEEAERLGKRGKPD